MIDTANIFVKTKTAFDGGKNCIIHKGGTGCLHGNTLIYTPTGYIKIKDLNIGDNVYSIRNNKLVVNKIINKFFYSRSSIKEKMIKFAYKNQIIICTNEHKFRIKGKWIKAIDIVKRKMEDIGRQVCSINNGKISNISQIQSEYKRSSKSRSNETCIKSRWIFKNCILGKIFINSQDSNNCIYSKQRKQKNNKPQERNKRRQQIRKFGVGNNFRKYFARIQKWINPTIKRFIKWNGKINRGYCISNKEWLQEQKLHTKAICSKIWNKRTPRQRYNAWENLETRFIREIEFIEAIDVYDIEVENDHNYLITELNIITHNSSKSFDTMIFIIYLALKNKDKIFTIVSESKPHLDIGVIRYAKTIIERMGITAKIPFNLSKSFYQFPNGSIVEFFSADRIDKALGARRYLLFGNEVNSLKKDVWDELARRSEIILADFNPTRKFWLEEWLEYYKDSIVIKSNYLDNPFLPLYEVERIKLRASKDSNFKKIHIDCEYGSSQGVVFKPEQIVLIDEFPSDVKYTYGLDFGYVAPSCMVKVTDIDDSIYIDEMFYRSGMNTFDLINEVKKHNDSRIYADSEDRRMINELLANGVNVFQAKKRAGSVEAGISYLQSKTIYITKRSINTIKEFRELIHEVNRQGQFTGNFLGDDHAIDGTRYSVEDRSSSVGIRSQQAGESMHQTYHEKYGNK
jgi:phage terminase large subunit